MNLNSAPADFVRPLVLNCYAAALEFSKKAKTLSGSNQSSSILKPSFSNTQTDAILALCGHTTNRLKPTTSNAYTPNELKVYFYHEHQIL